MVKKLPRHHSVMNKRLIKCTNYWFTSRSYFIAVFPYILFILSHLLVSNQLYATSILYNEYGTKIITNDLEINKAQ